MTDISKEAVDALLQGVTEGPWMVAGVRGKVEGQSVHNVFRYNAGEKRDEQICAVWYDTKTGLGAKDARFISAARELVPAQAAEIERLRAALDETEAREAALLAANETNRETLLRHNADCDRRIRKAEAERDALAAQLDDANARADRLEAAVIAAAKIGQIVGFLGFDEARIEAFREDCGPDLWEKARAHLGAKP